MTRLIVIWDILKPWRIYPDGWSRPGINSNMGYIETYNWGDIDIPISRLIVIWDILKLDR